MRGDGRHWREQEAAGHRLGRDQINQAPDNLASHDL
jgi:hypothetical protein